uniref:Uncharacterized protein n=1 Tax=Pavo cristatus TaxID=9049 RepID=A0A8C9G269_PAVCR
MSGTGVHGALQLLRSLPKVSLANLRPSPGSKKPVSELMFSSQCLFSGLLVSQSSCWV